MQKLIETKKVARNTKSCQKVTEKLVAKASPFKGVDGRTYGHETTIFLRWIESSRGGTGYAGSLRGNAINFRGNTLTPVTSYISLT